MTTHTVMMGTEKSYLPVPPAFIDTSMIVTFGLLKMLWIAADFCSEDIRPSSVHREAVVVDEMSRHSHLAMFSYPLLTRYSFTISKNDVNCEKTSVFSGNWPG